MQISVSSVVIAVILLGGEYAHGLLLKSELLEIPHQWQQVSAASPQQSITLTIGLRQRNEQAFYDKLHQIADPEHGSYGQWMAQNEVENFLKPNPDSKQNVYSWLQENGVTAIDESNDFQIQFRTNISTANRLMGADYQVFKQGHVRKIRTRSYSIPEHLDEHIDLIWPTTYLGNTLPESVNLARLFPKKSNQVKAATASKPLSPECDSGLTVACIKSYYGLDDSSLVVNKNAAPVAIASFLNATAAQSDFDLYSAANNLTTRKINQVLIHGATPDPSNTYEGNGNSQLLGGISWPLPITELSVGGLGPLLPNVDEPADQNTNEPWLDYINALLSKSNSDLPQVISHSYGEPEVTVPQDYAVKVCNGFAKLGARGVTILISSGDIGLGASCKTASNATRFNAVFPANCPFVTSVGGTAALDPAKALAVENEGAWTGSSGGFSDYFSRPSYQSSVVATYLQKYSGNKQKAYAPYVNFTGRASPDVSALAGLPGYAIYDQGQQSLAGGTSSSAPIWAAIIGLLNNGRSQQKKGPMGFINPFLYSKAASAGLRDITSGASLGCNGVNQQYGQPLPNGAIVPGAAWNATTGWDPSTGLGVPKSLKALLQAAIAC